MSNASSRRRCHRFMVNPTGSASGLELHSWRRPSCLPVILRPWIRTRRGPAEPIPLRCRHCFQPAAVVIRPTLRERRDGSGQRCPHRVWHLHERHGKPTIKVIEHLGLQSKPAFDGQLDLQPEPLAKRLFLMRLDQAAALADVVNPQRYWQEIHSPGVERARHASVSASVVQGIWGWRGTPTRSVPSL